MKHNHFIAAMLLLIATTFAACFQNPPVVGPGGNEKTDSVPTSDTTSVAPDTIGWNIPAEVLTVAQARDIASNLESDATSNVPYYIIGMGQENT